MNARLFSIALFLTLCLTTVLQAQVPANDNFANAITFTRTTNLTFDSTFATAEPGEPAHGSDSPGARRSIWFRTTPAVSGFYLLDIEASQALQPELAVYRGTKLSALTLIKRIQTEALVELTRGVTYYMALDAAGPGDVNFQCLDEYTVPAAVTLEGLLPDPSVTSDWAPYEYGKLTITLAIGGALSGSLELGQGVYRFASRVYPGGTIVEIARPNLPTLRLNIVPRSFLGAIYTFDVIYQPDITEARNVAVSMQTRTSDYAPDFVGTYNLLDMNRNNLNLAMSVGHGLTLGSVQVTAKGTATGTLIMADGETTTFSGSVVAPTGVFFLGQGELKIVMHKSLYRRGGQVTGQIHLNRKNINAPVYDANILWVREKVDPKRKAYHRTAAREAIDLHVERYDAPPAGKRIWEAQFPAPAGEGFNFLWRSLDHAQNWLVSGKLSTKNALSLLQPSARLTRFGGKGTALNGFFTGSFTDARPPQPGPLIQATFRAFYFPSLTYAVGISTEKDGTSYIALVP